MINYKPLLLSILCALNIQAMNNKWCPSEKDRTHLRTIHDKHVQARNRSIVFTLGLLILASPAVPLFIVAPDTGVNIFAQNLRIKYTAALLHGRSSQECCVKNYLDWCQTDANKTISARLQELAERPIYHLKNYDVAFPLVKGVPIVCSHNTKDCN